MRPKDLFMSVLEIMLIDFANNIFESFLEVFSTLSYIKLFGNIILIYYLASLKTYLHRNGFLSKVFLVISFLCKYVFYNMFYILIPITRVDFLTCSSPKYQAIYLSRQHSKYRRNCPL